MGRALQLASDLILCLATMGVSLQPESSGGGGFPCSRNAVGGGCLQPECSWGRFSADSYGCSSTHYSRRLSAYASVSYREDNSLGSVVIVT